MPLIVPRSFIHNSPGPTILAPVALDALGTQQGSGPTQVGSPITTTSVITVGSVTHGALLIAVVYDGPSTTLPVAPYGCTWDSGGSNQAMTQLILLDDGSAGSNNNADQILWFGLRNPTPGNKSIQLTFGGGIICQWDVCAISFSGVDQSSDANAFQFASSNTVSTGATTTTITGTSAANAMAVCLTSLNFAAGSAPTSPNHTQIWSGSHSNNYSAGQYAPGASSVTFTWSQSTAQKYNNAMVSVMPG